MSSEGIYCVIVSEHAGIAFTRELFDLVYPSDFEEPEFDYECDVGWSENADNSSIRPS